MYSKTYLTAILSPVDPGIYFSFTSLFLFCFTFLQLSDILYISLILFRPVYFL